MAYVSKDAEAVDNNHLIQGILDGDPEEKSGNWLIAIDGEQFLWTPAGASVARAEGGHQEDYIVAMPAPITPSTFRYS